MTDLRRAVSAEILKLKRTLALAMVVVAPALVLVLQLALYLRWDYQLPPDAEAWEWLQNGVLGMWGIFMLPLFVTLETALLAGVEHGEKHWKHLFALPVPRWSIYLAKLLVGMGLVAFATLVLVVGIPVVGSMLESFRPQMGFDGPAPWLATFRAAGAMFLASWLIIAFHTWVSIRWAGFVVPLAVGVAATFFTVFAANDTLAPYYPWLQPINTMGVLGSTGSAVAKGVLGGAALGAIGCWEATRRDVT